MGDEHRGGADDVAAGAVVAFEVDDGVLGEVLGELPDVPDVGAAPAVDGLVRVSDDAHVAVFAAEQAGQLVLGVVGVLVLVDEDVPVAGGVLLADPVVLAEQRDGLQQQVVEVERVGLGQDLLVPLVAFDQLRHAVPVGLGAQLLRRLHPVLPLADLPDQVPGGDRVSVVVQFLDGQTGCLDLVGGVVDDVAGCDPDMRAVGAQDAGAEGVVGRQQGGRPAGADQVGEPLAHLVGRLVGEGDAEDVFGLHDAAADEPGDAVADHAGLPGAWAGEDEQGPARVAHGGLLFVVEAGEQRLGRVAGGRWRGWCELCHRRLSVP